jgi:guanylate kinase
MIGWVHNYSSLGAIEKNKIIACQPRNVSDGGNKIFLTKFLKKIVLCRIVAPLKSIRAEKFSPRNLNPNGYGTLFILSGPSGVGKNTVASRLLKTVGPARLERVVTYTTRQPRNGERNGVDYNFISREDFLKKIEGKEFLEYARVHGENYYGSPRAEVEKILSSGTDALLIIDTEGVEQILQREYDFPIVTIFISPRDLDALRDRISIRGTESEESIAKRLRTAEREMGRMGMYDHAITSGSREEDFASLLGIYGRESGR